MTGGSTGGWEAFGVQVFYPDDYNGAWALCPIQWTSDRIDREHLRREERVLLSRGQPFKRTPKPATATTAIISIPRSKIAISWSWCSHAWPLGGAARRVGVGVRSGRRRRLLQAAV